MRDILIPGKYASLVMMSSCLQTSHTQTDNPTKAAISSSSHPPYQSYTERLKSYDTWRSLQVPKEDLARAGFFYKQHSDVVQCPYCLIEGYNWVKGDDPMKDHRTWNPNCPFVMNSIEHDNQIPTNDTCGLYGIQILPNSEPEDLTQLGIKRTNGPVQPSKHSIESRLETFKEWPKSMRQTPQQLAEAGFYYLGVGDQTICFYCGGGLKNWEETDDPWEEHAKWFPRCSYVFMKKGGEYIDLIKKQMQASVAVTETKEAPPAVVASSSIAAESQCYAKDSQECPSPTPPSDSKSLCKICYKNEVGIIFLPCGHVVACVDCATALRSCPICRKPLEATVRAFLS
ncbi:baculoviral IAP repeat-containing protein 7-B-like isoform X1 [Rhynchophorus ferrugineus]|uniref:baculoviral IAP repeat-containing protein 7-B-like isoform X1 n=2 Tax=Rhynchophorus ferrugineus TaxID=354439 RepID=UPI003FCCDFAF